MRRRGLAALGLALSMLPATTFAAALAAQTIPSKVSVATAERAESFGNPGPGGLTAGSDTTVLVLTLKGLDAASWENLNPDRFVVTSADQRYPCLIKMSGRIGADGQARPDFRVVFIVPKTTTSFAFHYDKESSQFVVSGPIKTNIR